MGRMSTSRETLPRPAVASNLASLRLFVDGAARAVAGDRAGLITTVRVLLPVQDAAALRTLLHESETRWRGHEIAFSARGRQPVVVLEVRRRSSASRRGRVNSRSRR